MALYLTVSLITLLLAACAGINQVDIGVRDKEAGRLIKEGIGLYDKGEYENALEKLSEAERRADLLEDKTRIADILSNGGFALLQKGLFDTALLYYNRSLEINRALDNKPGLILNYSYMGKIYSDTGKYEDGIRYIEEALEIQKESGDKAGIAHNLNNVASLYSYLGDYQRSIRLFSQALKISEETGDRTQTVKTLTNLATIRLNLRNYQTSIEYLNRALEVAAGIKQENLKANALNLIGVVYRQQGDYDNALANYQRALEINRELGLKTETALNLSIIGELYKELGTYDKALKYLQESLNMTEALKDKLLTAANLNYIGEVKYEQRDYEEAINLYDLSLRIFEEIGFKDGIARSYNNIGYLKGDTEQWDAAIENFDKALTIYRNLGDRVWIYVSLFGRGKYSERKGDIVSAEKDYKEAVDVFETIREDVAGGEGAEQLFSDVNVKIYENLVALLLRLGRRQEALQYIERSRSKALRDVFLRSGISSHDERTRGLLDKFDELSRKEASISHELLREKTKFRANIEKVENLTKTLASTREEFEEVSAQLRAKHPNLYGFLSIEPESIVEMKEREELPGDVVFVEYFITDTVIYIFVVSRGELTVKSVSIKKKELNELVNLFRSLLRKNEFVRTNGWRDDGSDEYRDRVEPLKNASMLLYGYLVKPIEGEIRDADTVAVIPFGSLHYLPFHALAKGSSNGGLEFLIEKKNLTYLVSTSADYLDTILRNGHEKKIGSVVAFGNPDLGEPDLALPYSEEEVLTIKEMFPNATVFIKNDATKDNFKNTWGKYEIVHLAAHGLIQREPSILLAPLGRGSLTLSDITELPPVRNTNLVVLSACEAAIDRNGRSPGVELNSIALAFTMAGTPSVIATLWEVDDRATSELMAGFYKNLRDGGKFDYKALRKAQLSMLRRSDRYGQPFYWAPFILLGVWE